MRRPRIGPKWLTHMHFCTASSSGSRITRSSSIPIPSLHHADAKHGEVLQNQALTDMTYAARYQMHRVFRKTAKDLFYYMD